MTREGQAGHVPQTSAAGHFAPTRWTLVLRARGDSTDSQAALSELCGAYYGPVLAFIRREGRNEEAAGDLLTDPWGARIELNDGVARW